MGQSESRPKSRKPPFSIDDKRAQEIQEVCGKFRILIIGRANTGDNMMLQKICDTTERPILYDSNGKPVPCSVQEASVSRGTNDIEDALVFESNPGFSFHNSRGFESSGSDELKKVKAFIKCRSKEKRLANQLHAIWYLIPVDDSRPFTAAVKWFFAKCDPGAVPVIAIFTKFNALDNKEFDKLVKEGKAFQDTSRLAPERTATEFENMLLKTLYDQQYPPKAHVYLRGRTLFYCFSLIAMILFTETNQGKSKFNQLIEKTAAAMNNEIIQRLFVSTQRNSLELCMRYGIENAAAFKFNNHPVVYHNNKLDESKGAIYEVLSWFPQHSESLLSMGTNAVYLRDDHDYDDYHLTRYI